MVKEAVKIKLGLSNTLKLGNLDATRDWGHAKDYVEAMWSILQLSNTDGHQVNIPEPFAVRCGDAGVKNPR